MAVLIKNNATGRLAGDIDATQTTISLEAGQGARFPSPSGDDWFPLTLVKTDGTLEIVHCTGRSNDTLTVTRGQEGTSATSFLVGSKVGLRLTAGAIDQIKIDSYIFPSGGIMMWKGSVGSIPTGWALCDGNNGTPDLRNRFIVGAGNSYVVGDTGGASSVTLTEAQMPAHNHTTNSAGGHSHSASTGSAGSHNHGGYTGYFQPTTSSAGSHSHSGSTNTTGSHQHYIAYSGSSGSILTASSSTYVAVKGTAGDTYQLRGTSISPNRGLTNSTGNHSHSLSINRNGAHTHTITNHRHSIGSDGAHTHSVTVNSAGAHTHTVNNTGGGGSHENRPPYYALAFIMKL